MSANSRETEITQLGNPRKPEGKAGEEMLKRMNQSHSMVTDWALSYFQWNSGDRVLDIGCGGGETLRKMSVQIPDGHLMGVDYSEVSVRMSTEHNQDLIQEGRMEIVEGSVEALPFGEGSFDKIITVESFYFWPDPAENLKEVLRVLRPGGVFLLVADIYQKEGLSSETKENIRRYQLFNPTREEFRQLFEAAGFQDIQVHGKEGTDWICVEGRSQVK